MTEIALVADIGGTNARFALARLDGKCVSVGDMHIYRAEDYASISDAALTFLEAVKAKPMAACFAVAAPITDDIVEFTNSPWILDIARMKKRLDLGLLLALNDFEALASGVNHLHRIDFAAVKAGVADKSAPTLVMGPGTGLGQAIITPCGDHMRVTATEGGHVAFAPANEEEIEVLRFIAHERRRVSIERVLSGGGLVNVFRALCAISGAPRELLQADQITRAAAVGENPIAVKTVDMFCAVLGAAAGDAVLATGARGRVVLGGGILPKIQGLFMQSKFVERFLDKGRMRPYVEDIPVDLIIRDGVALVGAAVRLKETVNTH